MFEGILGLTMALAESETETSTDAVESIKENAEEITGLLGNIVNKLKAIAPTIVFAVLIAIVGVILSKIIIKAVTGGMKRAGVDKTAVGFVKSLMRILLYTIAIVIALSFIGVPMTSIVTIIGAASVAVGLALKDSLSNVAGGFIILFAHPFKSGDFIETSNASGTVETISILYTKIITPDNKTVYIPNGTVSTGKITNYNQKPIRRLDLEFGISYNDDVEMAKQIISDIISKHEMALKDPEPFVRLGNQGDSALVIYARVWVNSENYWELNFDMLEKVKEALYENGIRIPFNQLDVNLVKESK